MVNDNQQIQDQISNLAATGIESEEAAGKEMHPQKDKNADGGDLPDGRERWDWKTRYPPEARLEFRWEAIYLFCLLIFSLSLIFATWKGWINSLLSIPANRALTLNQYIYYAASGMLGGVTFDIKYLYRVVARGFWHQDRRIWRIMSPYLAMTIALIVGAMINAGLMKTQTSISGAALVSIGFLSGYFADHAVAKMYEIANVFFGRSVRTKTENDK